MIYIGSDNPVGVEIRGMFVSFVSRIAIRLNLEKAMGLGYLATVHGVLAKRG